MTGPSPYGIMTAQGTAHHQPIATATRAAAAHAIIRARVIHAMTIPFTIQLVSAPRDGNSRPGQDGPTATAGSATTRFNRSDRSDRTDRSDRADQFDQVTRAARLDALLDEVTPRIESFLADVDATFSPFRDDSAVADARRGDWSALLRRGPLDGRDPAGGRDPLGAQAAPTVMRSPTAFAEIYALCRQAETLTDGHFDPMHAGVYDPTGIVKGWAVEQAHRRFLSPLLDAGRCEAAAIGGGGDIQTAVRDDCDFAWRIGVADPFTPDPSTRPDPSSEPSAQPDPSASALSPSNSAHPAPQSPAAPRSPAAPQRTLRTIAVRNAGVATSGTASRGEHITRTAHDLAQASVICDRLAFADMWATTAISAGEHTFRELIARNDVARATVSAVLVRADGGIVEIGAPPVPAATDAARVPH